MTIEEAYLLFLLPLILCVFLSAGMVGTAIFGDTPWWMATAAVIGTIVLSTIPALIATED